MRLNFKRKNRQGQRQHSVSAVSHSARDDRSENSSDVNGDYFTASPVFWAPFFTPWPMPFTPFFTPWPVFLAAACVVSEVLSAAFPVPLAVCLGAVFVAFAVGCLSLF